MERKAKVYLVGAGPGDPELLTRKAFRLIAEADVIIHDRLIDPRVLAVAAPHAKLFDAGKKQGQQEEIQQRIYDLFLEFGASVDTIVRLKSGDPMVFGRCGEEVAFLRSHGFQAEIVPGVSSAFAAPASTGIPLTMRGVAASFAIVAGHRQSLFTQDWSSFRNVDTLVVLMGVEFRDIIASNLIASGKPRELPVAFIESAATESERLVVSTLAQVAARQVEVSAPAVWVIGEVVRLRPDSLPTAVGTVLEEVPAAEAARS